MVLTVTQVKVLIACLEKDLDLCRVARSPYLCASRAVLSKTYVSVDAPHNFCLTNKLQMMNYVSELQKYIHL